MSETNENQANAEGTRTTQPTQNTAIGHQSSAVDTLRQFDQKIQRMADENARMEKNISTLAEFETRRIMGGSSEAGQSAPKEPEISPAEYAKLALGGKIKPK